MRMILGWGGREVEPSMSGSRSLLRHRQIPVHVRIAQRHGGTRRRDLHARTPQNAVHEKASIPLLGEARVQVASGEGERAAALLATLIGPAHDGLVAILAAL